MTTRSTTAIIIFFGAMCLFSCDQKKESGKKQGAEPKIKEETVVYTSDTANLKGYVVYDENMDEKRPAVLLVLKWWGLNDYTRSCVHNLAYMCLLTMSVDFHC